MTLYAAIDLHSNNGVLSILDDADRVQLERRLPNDLCEVLAALEPFRGQLHAIAVESTYNWYWLVDGLIDHGYCTELVNTAAVPQYEGLKHGNDHTDARHLAHLLRLGILPTGYIYPREGRALRDLLRRRFHLVRMSVTLMQSIQCAWSRRTAQSLRSNAFRRLDAAAVQRAICDPIERQAILSQLTAWRAVDGQVQQVERLVLQHQGKSPVLAAVRSVPGIGAVLGSTIALETGAIQRFASVGDYASYCRMVDSQRLSNGKRKGSGNAKCGNRYQCWAFIEAANFALRFSPEIRRWYDRKAAKRKLRAIAIKAVAHKLARACYYLMRDGGSFDVKRAFG
jgi:transposase